MIQVIEDKICWKCGDGFTKEDPKTMHHMLPKHLKSIMNIIVPLHASCHHKVTSTDIKALTCFAYNLQEETKVLANKVEELLVLLKEKEQQKTGL